MNKRKIEIYHAPTEKNYICLCLNTNKFTADCGEYMIDRFINYSVNPDKRFYSRVDKLIDDIIRGTIKVPHKYKMRLESRHCIENRPIHFNFHMLDKACLQCNVFLNELSDEARQACADPDIDFAILYLGVQGVKRDSATDANGGFCGPQPQVPLLADGACPSAIKPLSI